MQGKQNKKYRKMRYFSKHSLYLYYTPFLSKSQYTKGGLKAPP